MSSEQPTIDYSLPACGQTLCNDHGTCVPPPGGGTGVLCDCVLGYRGEFCEETVNSKLSLLLTVTVTAVIVGLITFACIIAKIRRRQKKNHRRRLAAGRGCNIAV